jgi:hypothetical protein
MNGRMHAPRAPLSVWLPVALAITMWLLLGTTGVLQAGEGRIFRCATSEDVHRALEAAGPGDTILLEGGRVYEIDKPFRLRADGSEAAPIRFTSEDPGGGNLYAVITTAGGNKEPDLKALLVTGSYWHISRLEISGTRVPLGDGYWDTNGFQLGLYLLGPGSHHNLVEDVEVHHTHNAAVAVRDDAHHIVFRRVRIHQIATTTRTRPRASTSARPRDSTRTATRRESTTSSSRTASSVRASWASMSTSSTGRHG